MDPKKAKFATTFYAQEETEDEGPKGKGKKSAGKKAAGKKAALDYTHGELPSGMLAPGYAAPEQVLQMDPKKAKFATTFYAEKK